MFSLCFVRSAINLRGSFKTLIYLFILSFRRRRNLLYYSHYVISPVGRNDKPIAFFCPSELVSESLGNLLLHTLWARIANPRYRGCKSALSGIFFVIKKAADLISTALEKVLNFMLLFYFCCNYA